MTDISSLITQIRGLLPKVSGGEWHPGHLANDDHPCNCRSVCDEAHAGAICTVHVDNELPISEGGNDAPPLSEAKANLLWIAALNPLTVTALLDRIEELEKALKPFARIADMEADTRAGGSVIVNIDRCRDARAALDQDKRGGE